MGFRPFEADPQFYQILLIGLDEIFFFPDGLRRNLVLEAERSQGSSGFPNIPFHRMQPVGSIGNMGGADILIGSKAPRGIWKGQQPTSI